MEQFMAQYGVWLGLAVMMLEYVLGKTDIIKANSTIEMVINTLLAILKFLMGERKQEKKK